MNNERKNDVIAVRRRKLSKSCECYDDFEEGCCNIFSCKLHETCDKGFNAQQGMVKLNAQSF